MGDLCTPYPQLCVAPMRRRPRRTAAGGRAACTRPQRGRTCGGTGPAGPTAGTGDLSGPIAPAGPGPCRPPRRCGGPGWREEQREAPGASWSHLTPSASFSCLYFFFFFVESVFIFLMCPWFALYSCFSSFILLFCPWLSLFSSLYLVLICLTPFFLCVLFIPSFFAIHSCKFSRQSLNFPLLTHTQNHFSESFILQKKRLFLADELIILLPSLAFFLSSL